MKFHARYRCERRLAWDALCLASILIQHLAPDFESFVCVQNATLNDMSPALSHKCGTMSSSL